MNSKQMDMIRQKFHSQLKTAAETSLYATIKEVDEAKRTCKAEIGNILYEDILLYSIENPDLKGFVFVPAIDSVVLVSRVGNDRMFVTSFSEIDKVIFTLNDLELIVDADNIDLKKGDNITIHVDAEKLEVTNDKVVITGAPDVLTATVDGSTIEVKPDVILFNGGDLGGLVKIEELKKNLDSLKMFVETMHAALPGSFSAILAAMSANGALGAQAYNAAMAGQAIQFEDMENEKVKH